MPKYTKSDIRHIITDDEFRQIMRKTISGRNRFFLALLYCTGRRPSEISGDEDKKRNRKVEGMKRKDIVVDEENREITFHVPISKVKKDKFTLSHSKIVLEYDEDNVAAKIIVNHVKRFQGKNLDLPLFTFCRKTGYSIVERASRIIGIPLCPYNFRHSRLTHLAEEGASITEMLRFKGSKSLKGLEPYLHAQEYRIKRRK